MDHKQEREEMNLHDSKRNILNAITLAIAVYIIKYISTGIDAEKMVFSFFTSPKMPYNKFYSRKPT